MSDDSQINVTVLRSVIDSYLKKKEHLEKREDEVREKLAQMRPRPPRRDESIEINIETRESIVRTTSQVITPTDSYSTPPPYSQNETYAQQSGELLFHSKYCAYKDSDKSINALDSSELINKYVSMPKKKSTGKSKFSYKNYDKRNDIDLDSDSEEAPNVNVSTRKHTKKRPVANPEQRETREGGRKHDKHSKRTSTRDSLECVPGSDLSGSRVDLNIEPTSDVHRYKKTIAALSKSTENRKMEYAAERLARIGLMGIVNDRTSVDRPGNDQHKHVDRKGSYSRYGEDERRDSSKFSKQEKSSRKSSNRDTDDVSRYPKLMEMLGCCPGGTSIPAERKHKKSHTSNKKSLSRKDSLHDFESNRDPTINLRRLIQNPSSASESGSMSQCEANDKTVALRRVDSCRSSDEDRVRSRSPYRSSDRRPRLSSPVGRPKLAPPTSGFAGPQSERIGERGYVGGGSVAAPYARDDRDERSQIQSRSRGSPASRPPVRDEEYRSSHRSTDQRSRPHSAVERLNESDFVGGVAALQYAREDRDERPHRQSHSPASRPPVRDEGYRDHRSTDQRLRPHSAVERLNESDFVGGGAALQYAREDRDERPHSQSHSRGNPDSRPPVRDEVYRGSHRSTEERLRSHSPAERLNDGGSTGGVAVTPYYQERKVERSRSPSRDQNQIVQRTSVDNGAMVRYGNNFDEEYSNNFLIFLIQKSLPRAMSSIILASNGCDNKPSEEVLSSVQEIVTIKKLICDELDRRESVGRPFKLRRREKQRLIKNFLYAKKINDRLEHGFSVREAFSNTQTKSMESTIRLHERTIQAIRQANQILGGDLPDPADADDLEKAAEECLRNLGKLHRETVANYQFPVSPTSKQLKISPYQKLPGQPLKEDTCKSCRQDWFANEVNRLKDTILNIEQQMNSQSVEKSIISRQINEVKQLTSRQNEEHAHNFAATHSCYQQKRFNETDETTKASMGNARSFNNAYPVRKMGGNASFSNAFTGRTNQNSGALSQR